MAQLSFKRVYLLFRVRIMQYNIFVIINYFYGHEQLMNKHHEISKVLKTQDQTVKVVLIIAVGSLKTKKIHIINYAVLNRACYKQK